MLDVSIKTDCTPRLSLSDIILTKLLITDYKYTKLQRQRSRTKSLWSILTYINKDHLGNYCFVLSVSLYRFLRSIIYVRPCTTNGQKVYCFELQSIIEVTVVIVFTSHFLICYEHVYFRSSKIHSQIWTKRLVRFS